MDSNSSQTQEKALNATVMQTSQEISNFDYKIRKPGLRIKIIR